jgi:hypothetical protein
MRGRLHGDPTLLIVRARSRQVYRTTFSTDQRRAIITDQPDLRDRLCLRLLLDYGLRKGALQAALRPPAQRPDDLHKGPEGARATPPPPRVLARLETFPRSMLRGVSQFHRQESPPAAGPIDRSTSTFSPPRPDS